MEKIKTIDNVYELIEACGLMPTIKLLFGAGTRIQLPFSESACGTEIERLELSVRSNNCLKKAGLKTVSDVIDAMMENTLWKIRGLGSFSRAEIHVAIYEFGYYSLTEHGKREFIKSLLELNKDRCSI